ncbi:hypothetical protein FRC11_013307, partial [Ceratobasidium sp. 423]
MSEPPAMAPPHVPALSLSTRRGPAPGAPGNTSGLANPPIPMALRQRDAAVTREVLELKGRLITAEDEIVALRLMVAELQSRDEASKHERQGLCFRLQQVQAHSDRLEAIVTTYLSSQGVNLDQLQDAMTMSELVVDKKGNDLSDSQIRDLSKILKVSLASIYGVTRFSPKDHGGYPKVSNAHAEWPSRNESGRKVPLHRFDFKEEYHSPKNQPSFDAWVNHCIQQGPALSGVHHLPPSVLNHRNVVAQCSKYYSSIKRQSLTYHGEQKPVVGIKRRGDGSSVAEPKQDPESEVSLTDLGPIDTSLDLVDQLQTNTGFGDLPFLADPSVPNHLVQAAGAADFQLVTPNEPNELLGVTGPSNVPVLSHGAKPQVTDLNKHNSNNNLRSRRNT